MKITKSRLVQIIKEEIDNVVKRNIFCGHPVPRKDVA